MYNFPPPPASQLLLDAETGTVKYGAIKTLGKSVEKSGFVEINTGLAIACLILPVIVFVATVLVMGTSLRYWHSFFAYTLAIILLVFCLGIGIMAAALAIKNPSLSLWLGVLCFMSLIAYAYGFCQANTLYWFFIEPGINIQQMTAYTNVDPTTSQGNQFMDYGIISFTENATINSNMSMLFKDGTTYCVAPVIVNGVAPASYDFWAVGVDCCSSGTFKCGDWNLAAAHSGLRVSSESEKQFYQLAVRSASATYNIPVHNPIFFTWAVKPPEVIHEWLSIASKSIVNGTIVLLCVDVLLLCIALLPVIWLHGSKL
jgi:hypothetical protein|mmetsp:Transcript_89959/g.140901  ORF Transcript_89959/g.140901 Transcript_89959/m.140901 type:complete len:315 (+) Transcript_89959:44-988(+)